MQKSLQLTFRDIEPTDAITSFVRKRAERLEQFFDRLIGCHVAVEVPHRHKRHGNHYRVRIDLVVPGGEIVVSRDPSERTVHEDLYATIGAAFDDAQRRLEDFARRRRGDVKAPALPTRRGRIGKPSFVG